MNAIIEKKTAPRDIPRACEYCRCNAGGPRGLTRAHFKSKLHRASVEMTHIKDILARTLAELDAEYAV